MTLFDRFVAVAVSFSSPLTVACLPLYVYSWMKHREITPILVCSGVVISVLFLREPGGAQSAAEIYAAVRQFAGAPVHVNGRISGSAAFGLLIVSAFYGTSMLYGIAASRRPELKPSFLVHVLIFVSATLGIYLVSDRFAEYGVFYGRYVFATFWMTILMWLILAQAFLSKKSLSAVLTVGLAVVVLLSGYRLYERIGKEQTASTNLMILSTLMKADEYCKQAKSAGQSNGVAVALLSDRPDRSPFYLCEPVDYQSTCFDSEPGVTVGDYQLQATDVELGVESASENAVGKMHCDGNRRIELLRKK